MIGFEVQPKTIKKYSVVENGVWGSTKNYQKYSMIDDRVSGSTKNYEKI